MGSVLALIQLIVQLGPLIVQIIKAIGEVSDKTKETVKALKAPDDAPDDEKRRADLEIQGRVTGAVKEKLAEEGVCPPDNIVNLTTLLQMELDKKRADKIRTECGPPIRADEGRFG